jgi:hypothetical protein
MFSSAAAVSWVRPSWGRSTGTAHLSSCRSRHTNRVVGRRSEEPLLTARIRRRHTTAALSVVRAHRGTDGSNPFPSSGESTNHRFLPDFIPLGSRGLTPASE